MPSKQAVSCIARSLGYRTEVEVKQAGAGATKTRVGLVYLFVCACVCMCVYVRVCARDYMRAPRPLTKLRGHLKRCGRDAEGSRPVRLQGGEGPKVFKRGASTCTTDVGQVCSAELHE